MTFTDERTYTWDDIPEESKFTDDQGHGASYYAMVYANIRAESTAETRQFIDQIATT